MRKIIFASLVSLTATLLFMRSSYAVDYSSITLEQPEFHEVAKVVAGESQNDTHDSQIAVVETIFNRCLDSRFPDTPYEVVSQKGQFSIWKIRNASWIESSYGASALNTVTFLKESSILPSQEYVIFSTKPQSYGYDYIKIGKTYFGKLK